MTNDCQVLIVGAGPTGLVLACELLARGIRTRIIDKGDGVVLQSRALGIHARTLEVLDMMGLGDRLTEHGQVVRRFHMYADGKTLIRLDLGRNGSRFGFMLDVPQDVTETILRQRVSELGGSVEQGPSHGGLAGLLPPRPLARKSVRDGEPQIAQQPLAPHDDQAAAHHAARAEARQRLEAVDRRPGPGAGRGGPDRGGDRVLGGSA